jgi:signal transduction histidine kinase
VDPRSGPPPDVLRKKDVVSAAATYARAVSIDARHGGRTDRLVAAGFVAAAAIEAAVRSAGRPTELALNVAGSVLFVVLGLRRTHPLAMMTTLTGCGLAGSAVQAWLTPHASTNSGVAVVAVLVAAYSVGAYGDRRQLLLGAWQPLLLILGVDLLEPSNEPLTSAVPFAALFVVVIPVTAGRLVRGRTRLVDRLRAQARELWAHREEHAGALLARERLRLAEQLHPTLESGMRALAARVDAVVAGAAPTGARADEAGATEIGAIERAARQLLAQTREAVVALAGTTLPEPPGGTPRLRRWRRRHELQPWTALAAAAFAAGLLVELPRLAVRVPAPLAVLACVLAAVPFAIAWAAPLAATLAFWGLAVGLDAIVVPLDTSFTAIGLAFVPPFLVAALATRPRAVLGLVTCVVGELACFGPSGLADAGVVIVLAWSAGTVLQERSRLAEQLRGNATLLAEQRAEAARRAVVEERGRLARELHDALGHSLTVIALQAEAARRLGHTDPARAAELVRVVGATTHAGLTDLAGGFTEPADDRLGSVDALTALVESARSAGLEVEATLINVSDLLGPEGQVAVHRVLQESLTNVLRHAPGASVRATVGRAGGHAEVAGLHPPGGTARASAGAGHGLTGMHERVVACGGQLDRGSTPEGGFRVRATLPVSRAAEHPAHPGPSRLAGSTTPVMP